MRRVNRGRLLAVVIAAVAVAGLMIGGATSAQARSARVPITSRAVAAVVLDHVKRPSGQGPTYVDDRWAHPHFTFGADLRYHATGEYDGDLLEATVEPFHRIRCPQFETCRHLAHGVLLSWRKVEPEEDSGDIQVQVRNARSLVTVFYAGADITRDPRHMHLEFPVHQLVSIARDPRLRLMTTRAAVRAGARVHPWGS
jgi:hypothetical protein